MPAESLSLYLLFLQYKNKNKNDIKPQRNEKSLPTSKETPNIEYIKLKKKGYRQNSLPENAKKL